MSAAAVDPLEQPLSVLLRAGSQAEHRSAEAEPFVADLMAGRVSASGYLSFLLRLVAVYDALESVGGHLAADPVAGPVVDPALHRREALARDVEHWWTSAGRSPGALDLDVAARATLDRSPATRAYVERVHASACWGGLYVAHHYTRYLGDLSGGQAMGRALGRTFGLSGGEGLAFFSFDEVPRTKPYKDGYRARLDSLLVDESGRARMLAEVRTAFALNAGVFRELSTQ